jgi:hypothetical protein
MSIDVLQPDIEGFKNKGLRNLFEQGDARRVKPIKLKPIKLTVCG